jgi:hypothetical protein
VYILIKKLQEGKPREFAQTIAINLPEFKAVAINNILFMPYSLFRELVN